MAVLPDTNGNSEESLLRISSHLSTVFLAAVDSGFLLRGARAAGNFHTLEAEPFYLGPAAVDAGYWYDCANRTGVVLTSGTGKLLESVVEVDRLQGANLCRWPVPLTCGGPEEP